MMQIAKRTVRKTDYRADSDNKGADMVFRSLHAQVDVVMRKQTIFRLLVVASLALLITGCALAPGAILITTLRIRSRLI